MPRIKILLLVLIAGTPISALALPPATSSLGGAIQSLRAAGFAGLEGVEAPAAPSAATPVAYAAPVDETQEALAALIRAVDAQQERPGYLNDTARTLGFEFQGDFLSKPMERQSTPDGFRHFSIARYQGETAVILDVYSKATKELRSYRASVTGALGAAAMTTKPNGVFHVVSVPNAEAAAGFAAELGFWTQYYRDHLKP